MAAGVDFSIVIVNWNTRDLLRDCLASIYESLEGMDFEVTVVDNGSGDGSAAMVRERFSEVRLIENSENLGFAGAVNQGIRASSGSYKVLLNSDTVVNREAIQGLLDFMDRTPRAGAAGLQLLNEDGTKQNSIDNFPTLATELLNKALLRRLFPGKYPSKRQERKEPVMVDLVIGACAVLRDEALRDVGLFDEDYFFFMEEADLCLRLGRAGWPVYHVPTLSLLHLQGKSKEIAPARAWIEYYRSNYRFFRKHRSLLSYVVLRIFKVLKLLFDVLLSALAVLATLGLHRRSRRKIRVYMKLLLWHLLGCPRKMGLHQAKKR
jgi:GT2 family glycosyltransferase